MDPIPIIYQIFSAYWYLILIIIVAFALKTPCFKGFLGEFKASAAA